MSGSASLNFTKKIGDSSEVKTSESGDIYNDLSKTNDLTGVWKISIDSTERLSSFLINIKHIGNLVVANIIGEPTECDHGDFTNTKSKFSSQVFSANLQDKNRLTGTIEICHYGSDFSYNNGLYYDPFTLSINENGTKMNGQWTFPPTSETFPITAERLSSSVFTEETDKTLSNKTGSVEEPIIAVAPAGVTDPGWYKLENNFSPKVPVTVVQDGTNLQIINEQSINQNCGEPPFTEFTGQLVKSEDGTTVEAQGRLTYCDVKFRMKDPLSANAPVRTLGPSPILKISEDGNRMETPVLQIEDEQFQIIYVREGNGESPINTEVVQTPSDTSSPPTPPLPADTTFTDFRGEWTRVSDKDPRQATFVISQPDTDKIIGSYGNGECKLNENLNTVVELFGTMREDGNIDVYRTICTVSSVYMVKTTMTPEEFRILIGSDETRYERSTSAIPTSSITVQTDDDEYNVGETVTITGTVINDLSFTSESFEENTVYVQVFNGKGTSILVDKIQGVTSGQQYSYDFDLSQNVGGTYRVFVSYDGASDLAEFDVREKSSPSPGQGPSIQPGPAAGDTTDDRTPDTMIPLDGIELIPEPEVFGDEDMENTSTPVETMGNPWTIDPDFNFGSNMTGNATSNPFEISSNFTTLEEDNTTTTTDHTKNITLIAGENTVKIAEQSDINPEDLFYKASTFNGTIPGPVIIANQGDTLNITLINNGTKSYSLKSQLGISHEMTYSGVVLPNQSKSFAVKAAIPGTFLYYGGGDSLHKSWEDMANGMYGGIIVKPLSLEKAKEFYLVFSEIYGVNSSNINNNETSNNTNSSNSSSNIIDNGVLLSFDEKQFSNGNETVILTNGMKHKYLISLDEQNSTIYNENAYPLSVKPYELVRFYVFNAGPNDDMTLSMDNLFKVVSSSFMPSNTNETGYVRDVTIPAESSAMLEAKFPEGKYYLKDNDWSKVMKGGMLMVESVENKTTFSFDIVVKDTSKPISTYIPENSSNSSLSNPKNVVANQTYTNPTSASTTTSTSNSTTIIDPESSNIIGSVSDFNILSQQNEPIEISIVPGATVKGDDAYNPNPVEIKTGQTVKWTNQDVVFHTVTSAFPGSSDTPESFDSGLSGPNALTTKGKTFEHTFTIPGEYPYYCMLHPNMIGTVIVYSDMDLKTYNNTELGVSTELKTYNNTELGIFFNYPSSSTIMEFDKLKMIHVFFNSSTASLSNTHDNVVILIEAVPSDLTLDHYHNQSITNFNRLFDYQPNINSTELSNVSAYQTTFPIKELKNMELKNTDINNNLKVYQVYTITNNNAYIITYTASENTYEKTFHKVEQILNSFQISSVNNNSNYLGLDSPLEDITSKIEGLLG